MPREIVERRLDGACASRATYPAWFLPIAALYDWNPDVTPALDFASLYGGESPGR